MPYYFTRALICCRATRHICHAIISPRHAFDSATRCHDIVYAAASIRVAITPYVTRDADTPPLVAFRRYAAATPPILMLGARALCRRHAAADADYAADAYTLRRCI